jgi:tripartite motif-containing protein 71
MRNKMIIVTWAFALAAAAGAWASPPNFVYEGQWRVGTPYALGYSPYQQIWVTEAGLNRIARYSLTGSLQLTRLEYRYNYGLDVVLATGYVYVTEFNDHRVRYLTYSGSLITSWGSYGTGQGQFNHPYGVTAAPATGYVYVCDCDNHRVQYFTDRGVFRGMVDRGLNLPIDVAVAPNGNLYVTEWGDHRVSYFTPTGSLLGRWGSAGTGNGQFSYPVGVAASRDGYIFVADSENHRIQFFTTNGSYLGKWGSYGSGNGQFNRPHGVAVTSDGVYVYVCENAGRRVQYFRNASTAIKPASFGRVKALFR